MHDLNQDGRLYLKREEFLRQAARINGYLHQYGARDVMAKVFPRIAVGNDARHGRLLSSRHKLLVFNGPALPEAKSSAFDILEFGTWIAALIHLCMPNGDSLSEARWSVVTNLG
jgi:hypothetical protein